MADVTLEGLFLQNIDQVDKRTQDNMEGLAIRYCFLKTLLKSHQIKI